MQNTSPPLGPNRSDSSSMTSSTSINSRMSGTTHGAGGVSWGAAGAPRGPGSPLTCHHGVAEQLSRRVQVHHLHGAAQRLAVLHHGGAVRALQDTNEPSAAARAAAARPPPAPPHLTFPLPAGPITSCAYRGMAAGGRATPERRQLAAPPPRSSPGHVPRVAYRAPPPPQYGAPAGSNRAAATPLSVTPRGALARVRAHVPRCAEPPEEGAGGAAAA